MLFATLFAFHATAFAAVLAVARFSVLLVDESSRPLTLASPLRRKAGPYGVRASCALAI